MKKPNRWLWAVMIMLLVALTATGCSDRSKVEELEEGETREYKITLTGQSVLIAGDEDPITLAAVVQIDEGQAPDGTTVRFNSSMGTISPTHAGTRSGLATTQLWVDTPGVVVITASVKDEMDDLLVSLTLSAVEDTTEEPGIPSNITLSSDEGTGYPDDRATIIALVTDSNNAVVPDGTIVTFGHCKGTLNPIVATTVNGLACTEYSYGGTGSDTVTAVSGDVYASITMTNDAVEGEPAVIQLYSSVSVVPEGFSTIITAIMLDASGVPVPDGTRVNFYSSFGTITSISYTSGGMATAVYRPGQITLSPSIAEITVVSGRVQAFIPITVEDFVIAPPTPHVIPRRAIIADDPISSTADKAATASAEEPFEFLVLGGTVIGTLDVFAFNNVNPDTITRSDAGGSFVADGIMAGGYVGVEGSSANDGAYAVYAVMPTTLVLEPMEALNGEPAGAGVTIAAKPLISAGDVLSGGTNSKIYLGVSSPNGNDIRISTTMGTLAVVDSALAINGNGTSILTATPDDTTNVVEFILTTPDYAGVANLLAEDALTGSDNDMLKVAIFSGS